LSASSSSEEHWTKILYERFPHLYLPILEARKELGTKEAEGVSRILAGAGAKKGKILDLACGIGRHSIPLAKLGYEVVGFDVSSLFVARARAWALEEGLEDKVRFYEGDIRRAAEALSSEHESGFDAIVNVFSSLGAYGEDEDLKMIRDLRASSARRCVLLIETLNRDFLLRKLQPFGIRRISQTLRLLNLTNFDLETSTLHDNWRFYTEMAHGNLALELDVQISGRVYTLHELKNLVDKAGWSYLESHGSLLSPGPVTPDTPSIVLVGRNS
jgi:SAM-dependent methyltransferase